VGGGGGPGGLQLFKEDDHLRQYANKIVTPKEMSANGGEILKGKGSDPWAGVRGQIYKLRDD